MENLRGRLRAISLGDRVFFGVVVLSLPLLLTSWLSKRFYVTELISNKFELHNVSEINFTYMEFLFWTIVITIFQLYRYYLNAMDIYDSIKIKSAAFLRALIHGLSQLILSLLTFFSFLILLLTSFVELYRWEIVRDYNVQFGDLMAAYAPMLDIKYLIWYFALMDVSLLIINYNYCKTDACDEETKQKFEIIRRHTMLDIPVAAVFALAEFAFGVIVSIKGSQSLADHHLGPDVKDTIQIAAILFLQYTYVVMELRRRIFG